MKRFAVLSLTLRGWFMLALALAALAEGLIRTDMAGLFWGSSFLLVALYAAAGNAFVRILASRGRRDPGFLEVHLPAFTASPGEEARARASAVMPRVFLPGFSVSLFLPLAWRERRIDSVRAPLRPGANSVDMAFRPQKRGNYAASAALIEVRDILGFTSAGVPVPLRESMKVFPGVTRDKPAKRPPEEGGDSVTFSAHRRRSEELLEVRAYFPGDDVRKLNWKVYAHMNELFLRIGEETPPPESRFLFIIDSAENPGVDRRLRADCLDGLVEACASAASAALAQGADVFFSAAGAGPCRSFSPESRPDLMGVLSDVWWSDPSELPELPPRRRMHAVVFSLPGSPSLQGILSAAGGRGWKTSVFLGEIPLPPAREGPRGLRDLLFVGQESR